MKRRNWAVAPLPWRAAGKALQLVVLLAVLVGVLCYPQWKLGREMELTMESYNAEGPGRLLWKGRGESYGTAVQSVLRQVDGRLYLGQLTSYEGRPYIHVYSGALPEGPEVSLVMGEFPWRARGSLAALLMGVSLPEETASGTLTVVLGPEVIRETEGVWEQGVLFFQPPRKWVEYEWGLKKDGIGSYQTGTLQDRPYTLTLYDENGIVISETSGTLGSIWRR